MSSSPSHPHFSHLRDQLAVGAYRVRESLSSRVGRFVCAVLLTLLSVAGVILFVVWLALRPHRPRFHVTSFFVPNHDPSSPISFSVSDHNPNRNIGIYYDSMDASVFYLNREIGSVQGLMEPFYQRPGNTTVIRGLTAGGVQVGPGGGAGGGRGGGNENQPEPDRYDGYRLALKSTIRFEVSTWDTHKHKLHVSCDMAVGPDGQVLREYREKRCSIYFS